MSTTFKDNKGNGSAKRIIGTIILAYVMLIIGITTIQKNDIPPNIAGILTTLGISGAAMISAGVFEDKFKK